MILSRLQLLKLVNDLVILIESIFYGILFFATFVIEMLERGCWRFFGLIETLLWLRENADSMGFGNLEKGF